MSSRLNDMRAGAKVIIMQRLSDRDLSGHVIRAGGYDHLRLPTEYEVEAATTTSISFRDPRRGQLRQEVECSRSTGGATGSPKARTCRPSWCDCPMAQSSTADPSIC